MLDQLPQFVLEIIVELLSPEDLTRAAAVCRSWRARLTSRERWIEQRWWREAILLQWEPAAARAIIAKGPAQRDLARCCWRTEYPRFFAETATNRTLPPREPGPRKEHDWTVVEQTPQEARASYKLLRNKKPKGKRPQRWEVRNRGDTEGALTDSIY